MEWISILKDISKLNTGIDVLCVNDKGKIAIGQIRFYTAPTMRYVCYKSSKIVLDNVTHWMALPKPPVEQ